MSTYKLIQDIEAEDHILGPLSLRQFLFALGAALFYYLSFVCFSKHIPFLLIVFLPPAGILTFFAFPFGKDQPTEVWALAKLRFLFKPRMRVWDQTGVKEMVTITAPKKIERVLTNGLDQEQVKSRLNALANTIDSRGWAIKDAALTSYAQPSATMFSPSDRLVNPASLPQPVPNDVITASEDILDEQNNPIARQFDHMIDQSTQDYHQQLVNQMNSPVPQPVMPMTPAAPSNDYWFMNQTGGTVAAPTYQPVLPAAGAQDATAEEQALSAQLKARNQAQDIYHNNLRTLQPMAVQQAQAAVQQAFPEPVQQPQTTVTAQPDPAILSLASNDDLNVATLAREASKAKGQEPPEEVVISLR